MSDHQPPIREVFAAVQTLAEHLTRAASEDVDAGAGMLARDRDEQLLVLARRLARTVDAYGTPARDVLTATGASAEVIAALDV